MWINDQKPMQPPVGTPVDFSHQDIMIPKMATDQQIATCLEKDVYAIPSKDFREGYGGDRNFEYWMSGLNDYTIATQCLDRCCNRTLGKSDRVLDFGGSTGRVARFFSVQNNSATIIADLKYSSVTWVNTFLSDILLAIQCSYMPSLPFSDNFFDVITAYSVFTHIDVFELAWLFELQRILKKGGVFILSLHTEYTWNNIEGTVLHRTLKDNEAFKKLYNKSIGDCELPDERMVFSRGGGDVYNCNVFHSLRYIKKNWSKVFDIVEVLPNKHFYQTLLVLKK